MITLKFLARSYFGPSVTTSVTNMAFQLEAIKQ